MATSTDNDFLDWVGQSTETQDAVRRNLFAVVDSYIENTGETSRLLNHIQQSDPEGTVAFVAENCPE